MNTVDNVFDSIPLRWRMEQWPGEIRPFAEFLLKEWKSIPATHVLELGVRHGGTSVLWHELLPDVKVIGVDRVGHDSYSEPEFTRRARQMESEYPRFRFVDGDTKDYSTLEKVLDELGHGKIGFLFIDADHSYDAVARDYKVFGSLVVSGGLVAFHDIVAGPRTGSGVAKFWAELDSARKCQFCVGGDWGGIGVIRQ